MSAVLRIGGVGAAILLLAGCAGVSGGKAGGGVAAETVLLAVAEGDGTPVVRAARAFADALDDVSAGSLTVDVRTRAHLGDDADDPSAQTRFVGVPYDEVARQVIDGEVEIAVVPDFAWAEAGAPGIAALKAPLVIDSDALMFRVAEEVGDDAIDGLRQMGLEPLVLLPESIRHPVGFGTPIQTVADFEGRALRIIDPFVGRALQELGADPRRIEAGFADAVFDGTITGAESAFIQVSTLPVSGIYTSDIALGAKFNVIAASGEWYSGLSAQQRSWIAEASDMAFESNRASLETDVAAAAALCRAGGSVVHAETGTMDHIRALVAPVLADVEASAGVGDLLQRIRAMKADLPAPIPPRECAPPAVEDPPVREAGSATTEFPEGTYRSRRTVEDFLSAGIDSVLAHNHAQVWTLTFDDGELLNIGCDGSTYTVTGDRISVMLGTEGNDCGDIPGQELFNARWTVLEGGALRFSDFGPATQGPALQTFNDTLWGAHDWVRVR